MPSSEIHKLPKSFKLKWKVHRAVVQNLRYSKFKDSKMFTFTEFPQVKFYFKLESINNLINISFVYASEYQRNMKIEFEIWNPSFEFPIKTRASLKQFHRPSISLFSVNALPSSSLFDSDDLITFDISGTLSNRSEEASDSSANTYALQHVFVESKPIPNPPTFFEKICDTTYLTINQILEKQMYNLQLLKMEIQTGLAAAFIQPQVFVRNGNLANLVAEKLEKDVSIVVHGQTFKVHKFVLCVYSPVFNKMFESNTMIEAIEKKVVITDFSPHVIKVALDYFYDLEILPFITISDAIDLLVFADKYDIRCLKKTMEEFLAGKLSNFNACLISKAAYMTGAKTLHQRCTKFLSECIGKGIHIHELELLDEKLKLQLLKASFTFVSLTR